MTSPERYVKHLPGNEVEYVVTFLAMDARPTWTAPELPVGLSIDVIPAKNPPVEYFLYLYQTVGASHEWTDWLQQSREKQQAFVQNTDIFLYTLLVDGWPGGFFMLDASEEPVCDLAYFGLVPQCVGKRLGRWFLGTAIQTGWDIAGTERMTVNTNTLDHPRAFGLYQEQGFLPVRHETHRRVASGGQATTR